GPGAHPPGRATRTPGGPIRPKPGEHGRFCAPNSLDHWLSEVMNRQNTQLSQRACNTPITVQLPMATMPEEMPMQRARARAAIATVNFADPPWRLPTQGIRGEAARADRTAPSLPVQCDDYVQDGHRGFPYCRSRRTLPGYQAGGFPPG